MVTLGLISDVERKVLGRAAHAINEPFPKLHLCLGIGRTRRVALERDEFPVEKPCLCPLHARSPHRQ